jgi:NCAIR mutase (PurE)-related protein
VNPPDLHRLLAAVAAGDITPRQAQERLAELPYADLGFAKLDLHRELRVGVPEAVFAEGKNADDLRLIVERLLAAHGKVLVTRLAPAAAAELTAAVAALRGGNAGDIGGQGDGKVGDSAEMAGEVDRGRARDAGGGDVRANGDAVCGDPGEGGRGAGGRGASDGGAGVSGAAYHQRARVLTYGAGSPAGGLPIAVVAAGTSDLPVAEEAAVCAEWFGHPVRRIYDVGIAGLHRLLDRLPEIRRCGVVVAVAGMDGALPTVLAGLVRVPIVAVPTSVGYGASFGGLAPLLTMLTGCAPGVGVVNIDNGYGAAVLASRIARPASYAAGDHGAADNVAVVAPADADLRAHASSAAHAAHAAPAAKGSDGADARGGAPAAGGPAADADAGKENR